MKPNAQVDRQHAADHAVVPAHRPAHDEVEHGHDHAAVSGAPAVQELGALLQGNYRAFFVISTSWDAEVLGKRDLDAGGARRRGAPSGDTRTSVDCDDLPGDVTRGVWASTASR